MVTVSIMIYVLTGLLLWDIISTKCRNSWDIEETPRLEVSVVVFWPIVLVGFTCWGFCITIKALVTNRW